MCRHDCTRAPQIGLRWRKGAKIDVARLRKDQHKAPIFVQSPCLWRWQNVQTLFAGLGICWLGAGKMSRKIEGMQTFSARSLTLQNSTRLRLMSWAGHSDSAPDCFGLEGIGDTVEELVIWGGSLDVSNLHSRAVQTETIFWFLKQGEFPSPLFGNKDMLRWAHHMWSGGLCWGASANKWRLSVYRQLSQNQSLWAPLL